MIETGWHIVQLVALVAVLALPALYLMALVHHIYEHVRGRT